MIKRHVSFSQLATMLRFTQMYYTEFILLHMLIRGCLTDSLLSVFFRTCSVYLGYIGKNHLP